MWIPVMDILWFSKSDLRVFLSPVKPYATEKLCMEVVGKFKRNIMKHIDYWQGVSVFVFFDMF